VQVHDLASSGYVAASTFALLTLGFGRKEECYEWLERCFEQHDDLLVTLRVEHHYRELTEEERFQHMLARLGLI
jgi:hypothetical protein